MVIYDRPTPTPYAASMIKLDLQRPEACGETNFAACFAIMGHVDQALLKTAFKRSSMDSETYIIDSEACLKSSATAFHESILSTTIDIRHERVYFPLVSFPCALERDLDEYDRFQ